MDEERDGGYRITRPGHTVNSGHDKRETSMETACWGLIVGTGLTGEKKKKIPLRGLADFVLTCLVTGAGQRPGQLKLLSCSRRMCRSSSSIGRMCRPFSEAS